MAQVLISYKTEMAKPQNVQRKWYVVDAENQTLGRLCSQIATILRGKNKPSFTPHVDTGDYVVVINADKVRLTGNKMNNKIYIRHTGHPGGQRLTAAKFQLAKKPTSLVEMGVKGMLPKNKLGDAMFKKLFAYAGENHPHEAQQPEILKF